MSDTRGEPAAIAVRELRKVYGNGVEALAGLSFTVGRGEIYGLLGPNGAGKSTTVRILTTLTAADGGSAEVSGHDVTRNPAEVRRKIGYVAQASGVDKHGTGRENLMLQSRFQRVRSSEIAGRVSALLEWVGLTDAADRLVGTYSGGMKRRLDLAMGLVHDPEVLFLDEPTTGLDPETRSALWRDLARLRTERKLTVLLTTHYLDEADRLCDRLAIVDHGKLVVEGTTSELKSRVRGDAVTLDLDGDVAAAAALLRDLDEVLEVAVDGRSVIARVAHGATAVPLLVRTLERAGLSAGSVTLSRPSLDDVYLHHTGHRYLADGGTKESSQQRPEGKGGRS